MVNIMGYSELVCPSDLVDNWQRAIEAMHGVTSSIDRRSVRERTADFPNLTFPPSVDLDAPGDAILFRKKSNCVRVSCKFNTDLQLHTFNISYDQTDGNVELARNIWDTLQRSGAHEFSID